MNRSFEQTLKQTLTLLLFSFGLFSIGGVSIAEAKAVLIEVFTSQNCQACALAEEEIDEEINSAASDASAASNEQIIALAYHVDYWDYLGDQDALADPLFGARQVGYNRAEDLKSLPTPQVFVNGLLVDRSVLENFDAAIASASSRKADLEPSAFDLENGQIKFEASTDPFSEPIYFTLVEIFTKEEMRALKIPDHHENIYAVKSLKELAIWDGSTPLSLQIAEQDTAMKRVLFAQQGEYGEILYAVLIE